MQRETLPYWVLHLQPHLSSLSLLSSYKVLPFPVSARASPDVHKHAAAVLQVLVMHDGKRLEYDSVPALLRMHDGAFRAMVEGAGISHEALNQ